jgi:drug/metabolite transporter (DMT)-like permease
MQSVNLRRKALQMLLLCTAFWSLSFPVMKALTMLQQNILPEAGSWFISSLCVMLRFLLAGILLLLFSPTKIKTATRLEVEQGLWLGLFVSIGTCLQMDGLAYTSASTAAFLTQLYVVFIPLWLALSRRRFPTMKILTCSALVLTGMALLVKLNPFAIRLGRGELETIIASMFYTAQILCIENPRYAPNRPQSFTTVMLLAMGVFTMPFVLASAPGVHESIQIYNSVPAISLLAVLVLVCSIVPFLLMNRFQRDVTATEAGLVYCAEPVLTSLLALFLPGWLSQWAGVDYDNEHLTLRLLMGGGLVTAANVLLQSRWLEANTLTGEIACAEEKN